MGLDLPAPSTERLERSPLTLVVCQVRHERNLGVGDVKRALAVHAEFADEYPTLEEHSGQELTIAAGPAGVQAVPSDPTRGWRMRSQDGHWTFVLMPDFFALETTRYGDWDDFRRRVGDIAQAVERSVGPALEQRIGLRFIDRVVHPDVTQPSDWKEWIDSRFLGPILHPGFGAAITSTQQILQIDGGGDGAALLRHGCVREGEGASEWSYLLDHDCFIQKGRPFEVANVMSAIDALHTIALQIFQAAITPSLYAYLRGSSS